MRQTPTTILAPLAALLVLATVLTGAFLAGAGPALAQDTTTTNATGTTIPVGSEPGGTAGQDTGTAGDAETSSAADTDATASITFEDQESASGESVLVESATVPEGGFVVITDDPLSANGSYDTVRGVSYALDPGTSGDIRIQLGRPLNQSGTSQLVATIHRDSNDNDQFDYATSDGQQDGPYTDQNGQILQLAEITVQQGSASSTTPATTAVADTTRTTVESTTAEPTATAAPTATAEPTASDGSNSSNGGGSDDGGDGGDGGSNLPGPGFGAGVAVIALLAAALLATRRT